MSTTEGGVVEPGAPPMDMKERLRRLGATVFRVGGLAIAVMIIAAIFSIRTDGQMLDTDNLLGIARAVSTVAIMSLGLLVVIIAGEIDLSFANLYGLSTNIVAVFWLTHEWNLYLTLLLAFAVAAGWGCFNAFLTAIVGIPSFIATLGSSTLIFGATLYIGETRSFSAEFPEDGTPPPSGELSFFQGLSNQDLPFDIPMQAVWTTALLVIFGFLLGRSIFGFRLKAIGGNREAARLARLPVRRYIFIAFIISACMACLAGLLDFAFVGSASVNDGQANLFPVFAAVIIGGASLSGGRGTVVGTLFGALLLAVLNNGLALEAAGSFAQQTLLGTVTILAVVLDRYTNRRAGKPA
jgi:ribose/xylose/arabinose/galactoside ABC-type transport system permease subunit